MIEDDLNEAHDSLNRINRVCKGLSVFIKIAFIVFCVCWLFVAFFMVVSTQGSSHDVVMTKVGLHLARGVIIAILFLILIGIFSDAAKGESPFTMKQANRLRKISYVLVIYGVLEVILSISAAVVDYGGISSGYMSTDGTTIISFNLAPFIAAAVVYAFSFVFKYGVLLQEFSDETL